ncbi:MAG TPA: capsule assembly Wzi family protein [Longimicrobiaceae bacterium]|nr:capsule assembly Wzi family protein [Longimicrobiaceae bacterium]
MTFTHPRSQSGAARRRYVPGLRTLHLLVLLFCLAPAILPAQEPSPSVVAGEVFAGGELERYLRVLQVAGKADPVPWSIRGFSLDEVARRAPRDSVHPWADRYRFGTGGGWRPQIQLHAPRTAAVLNSAFPYGANDGAVWAGRGLTTAVQAGVTARLGPLSLTLAPVAFVAQNAPFDLAPHVLSDSAAFADWRRPTQIDLPQRFGEGAYARVDPGQSTLRADVGIATLGVSTANQVWGPGGEYSLILGNNAPGFVHMFAGTSRPVNVGIGRVHGRVVWARLEQSPFATTSPDSATRFGTGLVASFTPRGVPGLELGATRFFHMPWPARGVGALELAKPLETFLKVNLATVIGSDTVEIPESVVANQIASVFARWTLPRSGFEVYTEFATEDHRHNLRDLILEPDHNAALTLGFQKVFSRGADRLLALRGEVVNGEPSHLKRGRRQEPFYVHAATRQGHTNRGQILGSPAAYAGSASTLAADYYHPGGRWTLAWRRILRQAEGDYPDTGMVEKPDVMQALGADAVLFRGRWDLAAGVEGVYNFNRNHDSDVANLNATLGVRVRL